MSTKPRQHNGDEKGEATDFVLSPEFWTNFVQQHWEKRPLLLKQPFASPVASSGDIFRGLVNASDRERAGDACLPLQFFNDQAFSCGVTIAEYLPESDDRSIPGYVERMTKKLNGQRFAFVLNGGFLPHHAQLWRRTRDFLHGLFARVPPQQSLSAIFLGNDESTPFGVHQDNSANFQFIIEGRKRMHLWTDEFVRNKKEVQGTHHYEKFLNDAITLEGEPGDVFYWPSSTWHIGECLGGLSVGLSVALRPLDPPWKSVLNHVSEIVEKKCRDLKIPENGHLYRNPFPKGEETISTVVKLAHGALEEMNENRDLARSLKLSELNRRSCFGWTEKPLPLPWKTLTENETVRGDPQYPILWLDDANHEIIVSANGHSFCVPADPRIVSLIERLNTGVALSVKSLIEEYAGTTQSGDVEYEADPDGIRTLLEKLYTLHGC